MPVQSRKHTTKDKKLAKTKRIFNLLVFLPLAIFVLLTAYIFILPARYWDGKTRLAMAIAKKEGAVEVAVFDPGANTINVLIVPANTEVDVARNLGNWRLGSVRELGKNEKVGTKLVSETVTKSLDLPTEVWAEDGADKYYSSKPFAVWQAMLSGFKTNLNIKDKVLLGFFAMGVNQTQKTTTDLSQTTFLTKAKLTDGLEGYKVAKTKPSRLLALFGDAEISKENKGIAIVYPRKNIQQAQRFGEIVQVLGVKVVALTPLEEKTDFDCSVNGELSLTRKKIADVFGCKTVTEVKETRVEIRVGEEFFKRF